MTVVEDVVVPPGLAALPLDRPFPFTTFSFFSLFRVFPSRCLRHAGSLCLQSTLSAMTFLFVRCPSFSCPLWNPLLSRPLFLVEDFHSFKNVPPRQYGPEKSMRRFHFSVPPPSPPPPEQKSLPRFFDSCSPLMIPQTIHTPRTLFFPLFSFSSGLFSFLFFEFSSLEKGVFGERGPRRNRTHGYLKPSFPSRAPPPPGLR